MKARAAKKITCHGDVQGVGFRFTVMRIALQYDSLTGYVRNCAEGTVEIEVAGAAKEVKEFVKEISDNTPGHIKKIDMQEIPDSGRYLRFNVKN